MRLAWAQRRRWKSSGDPDGGNPEPEDKGVTVRERLVEVEGAVPNRVQTKRRKACGPRVSRLLTVKPDIRSAAARSGDGLA